ncbi:MAG: VanW family protein [Thermoleophilia bacterium]
MSIDGVDVGGLSLAAAESRLEQHLNELAVQRIELVTPRGRVPVTGEQLGLSARIDDAIEDARGRRGAWSRLTARLGIAGGIDVPLALAVDEAKVDDVVKDIARRVDLRARNARLRVNEDGVAVVPGRAGRAVDRDRLRELLASAPEPERVEVPVVERAPEIDDADAAEARDGAERLLRPVNVTLRGKRARLDTPLLREALTITPRNGELSLGLDRDVLAARLGPAFDAVTRDPRDARFVLTENGIEIVEHRNGTEVDLGALVQALIARTGGAVEATVKPVAPAITTRAAESMQITELISEFTTEHPCCAPRVTNIHRAARILDGTVIRPGGTFSLNEALGQRTRKKGFVLAPMIEQGRLKDAVGGGVSQVATTMYNAAFFAGLDLVEHTPHQFYISRYPMGREATVSWREPDLVIRNDWPAGILIDTETTDTSITIRLYSRKLGRRVTTTTGKPRNHRAASTIRIVDGSLAPGQTKVVQDGGIEGFDVSYTRKVFENGKVRRNETWTVHYIPEDTIVHVGPPPAPAKPAKADG